MTPLAQESQFFRDHVDEWRRDHLGEFVVLHGNEIVGFFKTIDEAFTEGGKRFGLADFFVKQILSSEQVNISFFGQAY